MTIRKLYEEVGLDRSHLAVAEPHRTLSEIVANIRTQQEQLVVQQSLEAIKELERQQEHTKALGIE